MAPKYSGANKVVERVKPSWKGKLNGNVFQVPTPKVSIVGLVVKVANNTGLACKSDGMSQDVFARPASGKRCKDGKGKCPGKVNARSEGWPEMGKRMPPEIACSPLSPMQYASCMGLGHLASHVSRLPAIHCKSPGTKCKPPGTHPQPSRRCQAAKHPFHKNEVWTPDSPGHQYPLGLGQPDTTSPPGPQIDPGGTQVEEGL